VAEAVQSSLSPARLHETPANKNRWLLRSVNKSRFALDFPPLTKDGCRWMAFQDSITWVKRYRRTGISQEVRGPGMLVMRGLAGTFFDGDKALFPKCGTSRHFHDRSKSPVLSPQTHRDCPVNCKFTVVPRALSHPCGRGPESAFLGQASQSRPGWFTAYLRLTKNGLQISVSALSEFVARHTESHHARCAN
jgi:hypothetical protein